MNVPENYVIMYLICVTSADKIVCVCVFFSISFFLFFVISDYHHVSVNDELWDDYYLCMSKIIEILKKKNVTFFNNKNTIVT